MVMCMCFYMYVFNFLLVINKCKIWFQEFFQRPTEQSHAEMQATMANLRKHLDSLSDKLHKVC